MRPSSTCSVRLPGTPQNRLRALENVKQSEKVGNRQNYFLRYECVFERMPSPSITPSDAPPPDSDAQIGCLFHH